MTIIQFSNKEAERLHVIKEVAEWVIKQKKWAEILWIWRKQMWRLVEKRRHEWDICVINWLKWKRSNNHEYDTDKIKKIIHCPEYVWFGPTFMQEKLQEIHKIKVSIETIRKIMILEWLRNSNHKKHYIYRQRRERKASVWEMIQFDGSYHFWFEGRWGESCLLVAIDDATSKLLHCKFTDWEWFAAVSQFWIEYILKYWVPRSIYVDRFSTYSVVRSKKREEEMITNFRRIMWILWCEIIFANSPQAKWRVERVNKTLQDRLIKEMRLVWISRVEEWNKYLTEVYIPKHNKKFAVNAVNELDEHKSNQYTQAELERLFAKVEIRSLWNDYIIQFASEYYQVFEWEYVIYPKKKIEVYKTFKWDVYMKVSGKELSIQKCSKITVEKQRKQYRYQKHKIEQEAMKKRQEERRKMLNQASKQRKETTKQLELDLNI